MGCRHRTMRGNWLQIGIEKGPWTKPKTGGSTNKHLMLKMLKLVPENNRTIEKIEYPLSPGLPILDTHNEIGTVFESPAMWQSAVMVWWQLEMMVHGGVSSEPRKRLIDFGSWAFDKMCISGKVLKILHLQASPSFSPSKRRTTNFSGTNTFITTNEFEQLFFIVEAPTFWAWNSQHFPCQSQRANGPGLQLISRNLVPEDTRVADPSIHPPISSLTTNHYHQCNNEGDIFGDAINGIHGITVSLITSITATVTITTSCSRWGKHTNYNTPAWVC